jgi:integrase
MGRQTGCIFKNKNGQRWFARWRESGKMYFRDLAPVSDAYRTKKDVQPLLDDILRPINSGKTNPESNLSVAAYGDNHWLPWVRENCKPSTIAGYEFVWNSYLSPRLQATTLRDFRTFDAANILADLYRVGGHGRNTLKHAKGILSGIFTLARNQGVLDTPNPVQGTMIPKKAAAPKQTHAASLQEVTEMLNAIETAQIEGTVVPKEDRLKVRAAIALQFFAGLRPGEARGARWENYRGKTLAVTHSMWQTHITTPKTEASAMSVPIIEPLRSILADLRERDGNPATGPILRGSSGAALNLDNAARRIVRPLLKAANMEWHGWYSLRRGVATTLTSLSRDSGQSSKGLLRHTSLATTQRHYIKDVPENTLTAMNQLEQLFSDCSTVKQ